MGRIDRGNEREKKEEMERSDSLASCRFGQLNGSNIP